MNILLTGGTGLIGKELGKRLAFEGHKIWLLSRGDDSVQSRVPFPCEKVVTGDLTSGPVAIDGVEKLDAVIHLAGESIMGRWNEDKKDSIWNSRINGTKNLLESLTGAKKLKVVVSASGIGGYGDKGDEELTEEAETGDGFLAAVVRNWEEALFSKANDPSFKGARFVAMRTPMVLSRGGGALAQLAPLFRSYLGAPLGSGQQWMSWIHPDDLISAYLVVLTDERVSGPVNACSPQPIRNIEFTKSMARSLEHKSLPIKVPDVGLEVVLGEAKELVLNSQKAVPKKLEELGFEWSYPELDGALGHLMTAQRAGDSEIFQEQYVQASLDEVFAFFSSESNLEKITPPQLRFEVLNKTSDSLGEGTEINYRLKLYGVPLKWTSVIEKWEPGRAFVDRQVKGPYKKWIHTHTFEKMGDGVLVSDYVRYRLPVGILGRAVGSPFVTKDLKKIFDYRREFIAKEFSKQ